jgi:AcrR family transcriptional regulator
LRERTTSHSLGSRTAARRVRTRRAILDATQSLLLELGAERVTIRRVEERSGYRAPTIYHYFHDKTGLIDALLEERCAELLASLRRVARPDDPGLYLRELARAYLAFGLAYPEHYALIVAPRRGAVGLIPSAEAARELVASALADAARTHSLGPLDPEAAFQSYWAMLHGVLSLRASRPDYPWRPDLVELALTTIERGILQEAAAQ